MTLPRFFAVLFTIAIVATTSSANPITDDSSNLATAVKTDRQFRESKKIMGLYQPAGFGPIPEFSQGFTAGYFMNRDLIIQLDYTSTQGSLFPTSGNPLIPESSSGPRWFTDMSGFTLGLNNKWFLGNSFYLKSGFDYRRVNRRDYYAGGTQSESDLSVAFIGESILASLAIGNQWQYSYFTFGCDWIGAALPLFSSIREETSSGPVTSVAYARRNDDENRYLRQVSMQLLRVYVGASF